MIYVRAPYRISFLGGGTDYREALKFRSGATISTSINRYCHVFTNKTEVFFPHIYRAVYSKIEQVNCPEDFRNEVIRAAVTEFADSIGKDHLEIHHTGDLPAMCGMGSSSAFMVALIKAIRPDMLGPLIFDFAYMLERKEGMVGMQDQYISTFGGFRHTTYHQDSLPESELLDCKWLEPYVLLLYPGGKRVARNVAKTYKFNTDLHDRMLEIVAKGRLALERNDPETFGYLVNEAYMTKRQYSDKIPDKMTERFLGYGLNRGAFGGKVLGAGGGGMIMFIAPPERHDEICEPMMVKRIPFKFEEKGVHVIWNN